jgi:hypothetical protein
MRTLLVCFLAVLAAVSANQQPQPFKAGHSYVYRLKTQVASSLIGASPAEIQQVGDKRDLKF